jgi:hypothetical protein
MVSTASHHRAARMLYRAGRGGAGHAGGADHRAVGGRILTQDGRIPGLAARQGYLDHASSVGCLSST